MSAYQTQQRKLLLDFLNEHPHEEFSARHLANRLPSGKISQSAVYRNLNALEQDGFVRRIVKNGCRDAYYQYTQASQCHQLLHTTCLQCGQTEHSSHAVLENLSGQLLHENSFTVAADKSILYGYCGLCSKNIRG